MRIEKVWWKACLQSEFRWWIKYHLGSACCCGVIMIIHFFVKEKRNKHSEFQNFCFPNNRHLGKNPACREDCIKLSMGVSLKRLSGRVSVLLMDFSGSQFDKAKNSNPSVSTVQNVIKSRLFSSSFEENPLLYLWEKILRICMNSRSGDFNSRQFNF